MRESEITQKSEGHKSLEKSKRQAKNFLKKTRSYNNCFKLRLRAIKKESNNKLLFLRLRKSNVK